MKKKLFSVVMCAVMLVIMCVPAFAADSEVVTAVKAEMDTMKGDATALILIAIGVGLGLFALTFGVKKAISALRGMGS